MKIKFSTNTTFGYICMAFYSFNDSGKGHQRNTMQPPQKQFARDHLILSVTTYNYPFRLKNPRWDTNRQTKPSHCFFAAASWSPSRTSPLPSTGDRGLMWRERSGAIGDGSTERPHRSFPSTIHQEYISGKIHCTQKHIFIRQISFMSIYGADCSVRSRNMSPSIETNTWYPLTTMNHKIENRFSIMAEATKPSMANYSMCAPLRQRKPAIPHEYIDHVIVKRCYCG